MLDTWASARGCGRSRRSAGPTTRPTCARFYPTQFLSTAREIIYLWVARMVMAGYEFMDHLPSTQRCPFAVCYMQRDRARRQGRRMSKSARQRHRPDRHDRQVRRRRRALLADAAHEGGPGHEASRPSASSRAIASSTRSGTRRASCCEQCRQRLADADRRDARRALEDRWILSRLARVRREAVSAALDEYRFNDAAHALYRFMWNDFCDWYVEIVKAAPRADRAGRVTPHWRARSR